jgi:hypothetical protein
MRYNFKKFLIIFFFLIFLPLLIKAIEFNPPWQTKSFQELLDAIYNFIFWVAIAIVPIMVIVAAYFFLTSGGDPEKIRTAKKIIFWTFIGLIIVLLGKGVVAIIGQLLGGGPSGGPGPGPSCGNGSLDPGEECDPPQDAACPGRCQADCTCRGLTATKLLMLGDVNKDCKIDGADIGKISHDIGAKPGDPNWSPDEDLNGNGVIDDCDEMIAANSFGLKCGDLLNATKLLMLEM